MGRLLKGALAHKGRLAHTALAVALAVGLVVGTISLSDTIDVAFRRASTPSPSSGAVVVRSAAAFTAHANSLPEREPLPESLLESVRAIPGVGAAWGSVSGFARVVDESGKNLSPSGLPTLGASWSPADSLVAGRAPDAPDEVVIDEGTAAAQGLEIGDRISILFQDVVREFVIEGLRRAGHAIGSSLAAFDLQTTQQMLGQPGRLSEIRVQPAPGLSPEVLRARLTGLLPDAYEIVTDEQAAEETEQSWTEALRFLTTGLLVFAAVALLVSAFLIFNTFSILVAQRTRELGLMRAVGASRRQVSLSVLVEAVAVGVVGSAAGVLLGFTAARGMLALIGVTGFELPSSPVVFSPVTVAAGLLCGVVVTVLAAAVPARRATCIPPMAAIASVGGEETGSLRARVAVGSAFTVVGIAELLAGLSGDVPRPLLALGIGAAGVLSGLALLAPLAARPIAHAVGAPLARLAGEPGRLGRENAMRNPRRTAATAAALTIGMGLIGVVTILAASMRASATRSVEQTLLADFVVTGEGTAGTARGVPPLVATRLREVPGVQMVSQIRGGQWGLDGKTMTLLAVDPATVTAMHELDPGSAAAARSLDDKSVIVRDTVAARHGWKFGDAVPMVFAKTGTKKLRLAGTFSTTDVRTDYVISLGAYEANYAQQFDLEVDVQLVPGTESGAARAGIEKALADLPGVRVMDPREVLERQETQVRRILVPVSALLGLSVIIALLGIANTLALSVHERTRELGLLRAIGMGRDQLRTMVRAEAVIISVLGSVLGLVVAVAFGWAVVSAMHDKGMTELVVPVGQLMAWAAAATAAGAVAASLPARRAARLDVLDAVAR